MKLYFYRGHEPNFGDELNLWLMPKVFPNFFDDDSRSILLAIGSVLFDHHSPSATKIVFGSGYGGYTALPQFDDKWKFYCVRGPLTSAACNLDLAKACGDTAILMNRYRSIEPVKRFRFSFMPHWESRVRGQWRIACALAGIHFLDPRRPVPDLLSDLEASEVVITEAMHGAIVSDALRVPWIPVMPFHSSHRFKWHDWAGALDMSLSMRPVAPSSWIEANIARHQSDGGWLKGVRGLRRVGVRLVDMAFASRAAAALWQVARGEPCLSSDHAMSRAVDRLETHARQIRLDYGT